MTDTGTPFTIPAGAATFVVPGTQTTDWNATRAGVESMYGYDPLGVLTPSATSLPGSANYEMSKTYYLANPDQNFTNLTNEYAAQQGISLQGGSLGSVSVKQPTYSSSPQTYDTSSAYGIAQTLAASDGAMDLGTLKTARSEGYSGNAYLASATNTSLTGYAIPASQVTSISQIDLGMNVMPTVDKVALAQGADLTVPSSALTGGTLTLYGPGIGAMNTDYSEGVKVSVDPTTGEISEYAKDPWGNYSLIGGAGRYAAQSGEFSVAKYNAENTREVFNLNLNTISPFYTENIPKSQAPGADIPWRVSSDASALMLMNQTGITGSVNIPGYSSGQSNTIGGLSVVPGSASVLGMAGGAAATLPSPYISSTKSQTTQTSEGPIGVFISGVLQGKVPSAEELWTSTPVSQIASNLSWDLPTSLSDFGNKINTIPFSPQTGTTGLLNMAAIIPLGSEVTDVGKPLAEAAAKNTPEILDDIIRTASERVSTQGIGGTISKETPNIVTDLSMSSGFREESQFVKDMYVTSADKGLGDLSDTVPKITKTSKDISGVIPSELSVLGGGALLGSTAYIYATSGNQTPVFVPGGGETKYTPLQYDIAARGYAAAAAATGLVWALPPWSIVSPPSGLSDLNPNFVTIPSSDNGIIKYSSDLPSTTAFSGGNQTITYLEGWISQNRNLVDTSNKTQVNRFNSVVDTYNAMSKENPIVKTVTGGTETTTVTSSQKTYPYGELSIFREEASNWVQQNVFGFKPGQMEAYKTTIQNEPGAKGLYDNIVYGAGTVITDPVKAYTMAGSALLTVVGISTASEAVGGWLSGVAEGSGRAASIAGTLTTPGTGGILGATARTVLNYSLPAAMVGYATWETTEGFTATPNEIARNVGVGIFDVAAFTYAGVGYSGQTGEIASQITDAYRGRISTTQILDTRIDYTARPDVSVSSGVGGSILYTESSNVLAPTTFNLLGKEITIPRVFAPSPIETRVNLENVDVGSLLGARLEGTEASPIVGSRVVTSRLSYAPGDEFAIGTGELRIGEVTLPRTFRDYMSMAVEDSKITGQSPDELAASYMKNAADVVSPTTGFRQLNVAVDTGTNIREAFNWNVNRGGGTELELNRLDLEDYVGKLSIARSGSGLADYTVNVVRDVGEAGFGKTGNVEITGSQTPESKIISQLQEMSRNIGTRDVEHAMTFDTRGNLIYEELGQKESVSADRARAVAEAELSKGGTPSFAHTHPPESQLERLNSLIRIGGSKDLGIITKLHFIPALFTRDILLNRASRADLNAMATNRIGIAGEYIASPRGVLKFSAGAEGWSSDVTQVFIGKNEALASHSYTARTTSASEEMRNFISPDVRTQFQDTIDRMVLGNPNLEFVREPHTPETSLSQSGSNLGTGGGGGGNGGASYNSPLSMLTQKSVGESVEARVSQTRISDAITRGSDSIDGTLNAAYTAPKQSIESYERVTSVTPSYDNILSDVSVAKDSRLAYNMLVSPSLSQGSLMESITKSDVDRVYAFTPISGLSLDTTSRQDVEKVTAYSSLYDQLTSQDTERVTAIDYYRSSISDQTTDQERITNQITDTMIIPATVQTTLQITRQPQITQGTQTYVPYQPPVPYLSIPTGNSIPYPSSRRRGPVYSRFLETFGGAAYRMPTGVADFASYMPSLSGPFGGTTKPLYKRTVSKKTGDIKFKPTAVASESSARNLYKRSGSHSVEKFKRVNNSSSQQSQISRAMRSPVSERKGRKV